MAVPVQLAPSSHMLSVKLVQVWKGKRSVLLRLLEQSIFSPVHKKLKERGILGGDSGNTDAQCTLCIPGLLTSTLKRVKTLQASGSW